MEDSDSESVQTVKENSPKTAVRQDPHCNFVAQQTDTASPSDRYRYPFHENLSKNLPLINPSALETLGTLMQEIQNTSGTDPEILKNCEARWLQLFKLVEKQYQDQILSQQDQYQCQIQLIQDEIKALIQLQNDIGLRHSTARLPSFTKLVTDTTASTFLNGDGFEELECKIKSFDVQSDCSETEEQVMASNECNHEWKEVQDNVPLTSEYGKFSASMQSDFHGIGTVHNSKLNTANSKQNMKENDPVRLHYLSHFPQLKESGQPSVTFATANEYSVTSKSIQDLRTNLEESSNKSNLEATVAPESLPGKQNKAKGLTSWAQKVRQKNHKSKFVNSAGLERMQPQECGQPQETETPEDIHLLSASSSHNSFYLSRPSSSPNSVVSNISGLSYWRLNERELYHSLPKNKEADLVDTFSSIKTDRYQLPVGSRWQVSSLREIYNVKQKENQSAPGWELSSPPHRQSPPQVLTLDPTLHMKPPAAFSPQYDFSTPVAVSESDTRSSVSPDSIMNITVQNYSDHNSELHVDTLLGSELTSTSRCSQQLKSWNLHPASRAFSAVNSPHSKNLQPTRNAGSLHGQVEGCSSTLAQLPVPSLGPSGIKNSVSGSEDHRVSASSLEDPIVLSIARLNLREKHARHVADIRAYYEAEINSLREKLASLNGSSTIFEAEKHNEDLLKRCEQLERALTEAGNRIQDLENKNYLMEMELTDWPARYDAVSATANALQQRLDEMRKDNKEKDNMVNKLNSRLKDLEDAFEKAYKHSDNKDARMKQEHKILQNLLVEYESLGKEHERVKETLSTTEDKLVDANSQISELKRVASKLEAQIRQVEHERNYVKVRLGAHCCSRTSSSSGQNAQGSSPSGSPLYTRSHAPNLSTVNYASTEGHTLSELQRTPIVIQCPIQYVLFHQPDENHSPTKTLPDDVARRKWLTPGSDYSIFTGQPLENHCNACSNDFGETNLQPRRYHSPPEKDNPFNQRDPSNGLEEPIPPILKALQKLDSRNVSESWEAEAPKHVSEAGDATKFLNRRQTVGFADSTCSGDKSEDSVKDRTRSKSSRSSPGQRSSSVPPSNRRLTPTSTPTKRNTLLTSLSAKSSPKRCPKENLSPGFNHLLGKEENTVTKFDVNLDEMELPNSVPSHSSSPRKRLQFLPLENTKAVQNSRSYVDAKFQVETLSDSVLNAMKVGSVTSRPAWEDKMTTFLQKEKKIPMLQTPYETELTYKARMEALGETEKLFDALTQEKQQIEAALSRIPGSTGRMTLQARLEKEALEDRLEKINRDLGSIRMTLKRFHILRTSANL
ncbi:M-phase phosphoprotein 9 isoform X2 [Chiloscyllium plagiosum]|uniref:M-phase phosphoprotein 9 isoform X2 n=1 Tax=Chiloscyllium plagiosum TaxID=36176 RepID=UPI001CB818AD|nr:M-phase phosphoprotein 9 isoform X2 [Chiloscyllium plagiosum]